MILSDYRYDARRTADCFPGLRATLSCQQDSAGICLSGCPTGMSSRRTCRNAQFPDGRVLLALGFVSLRLAHHRAGGRRQVDIHGGGLVLPRQATDALARRLLWQISRHVDGTLFVGPGFGLVAGDDLDVGARFPQAASCAAKATSRSCRRPHYRLPPQARDFRTDCKACEEILPRPGSPAADRTGLASPLRPPSAA